MTSPVGWAAPGAGPDAKGISPRRDVVRRTRIVISGKPDRAICRAPDDAPGGAIAPWYAHPVNRWWRYRPTKGSAVAARSRPPGLARRADLVNYAHGHERRRHLQRARPVQRAIPLDNAADLDCRRDRGRVLAAEPVQRHAKR